MAEDDGHRRVEPRTAIPGSGMLTEPDRLRALEDEGERRKRVWREPPAEGFGTVLARTPAKAQEPAGTYIAQDLPPRAAGEGEGEGEGEGAPLDDATGSSSSSSDEPAPETSSRVAAPGAAASAKDAAAAARGRPRPNELRDPRMQALHRLLDEKKR